jgi:ABC-2 type transport system permease protein/lipopolysaccharide transport system permease protein
MFLELIEYRELLYRMTARDLLVRYKQSVMGFGWAVFMPLVNTVLFTVIFSRVAPMKTEVPYPVFAYTGLLFWNFFASSLRFAVISLSSNATLVTKVYFPREIFPFSAVLVCLVDLLVGATILVAMMVYYQIAPTWTILYLPVVLLVQVMFTAGVGLIIAMANLFLRDVKYLFEIVLTVWMFATSVLYPLEDVGGKLGMLLKLNPMTPVIDGYRATVLLGQPPDVAALSISGALAIVTLLAGWLVFHRAEYQFAENA